jgi:hypothetical protein
MVAGTDLHAFPACLLLCLSVALCKFPSVCSTPHLHLCIFSYISYLCLFRSFSAFSPPFCVLYATVLFLQCGWNWYIPILKQSMKRDIYIWYTADPRPLLSPCWMSLSFGTGLPVRSSKGRRGPEFARFFIMLGTIVFSRSFFFPLECSLWFRAHERKKSADARLCIWTISSVCVNLLKHLALVSNIIV